MNPKSAGAGSNARTRRRLLQIAPLVLVLVAVMLGLAWWQKGRAEYKGRLQELALQQRSQAPLTVNGLLPDHLAPYRHVRVQGRWLGEPLFLDNQVMHGRAGYQIIMAFLPQGEQRALLVRRGWMVKTFGRTPQWQPGAPAAQLELEVGQWPAPAPLLLQGRTLQALDRAALSDWYQRPLHPLLMAEVSAAKDGLQRQWPAPTRDEVHKHLSYAGQWLLFSLLLSGVYIFYVRRFWRRQP